MNLVSGLRHVDCCSSSPESEFDEFKITRKTEKNALVVGVDEDARLYCQTNVPWKKCVWKPPRNGVREVRQRQF